MRKTMSIHPPTDRLANYVLRRLVGPELDEIDRHLSFCDSCHRLIRFQPVDAAAHRLAASAQPTRRRPGKADSFMALIALTDSLLVRRGRVTLADRTQSSQRGFQHPSLRRTRRRGRDLSRSHLSSDGPG